MIITANQYPATVQFKHAGRGYDFGAFDTKELQPNESFDLHGELINIIEHTPTIDAPVTEVAVETDTGVQEQAPAEETTAPAPDAAV